MNHRKKLILMIAVAALQCAVTGCSSKEAPESMTEMTAETVESVQADMTEAVIDTVNTGTEPEILLVDQSRFFDGVDGSSVFYTPSENRYEVYNETDANRRRSPCSTFKIISTLTALEEGVITPEDSERTWSGEMFWNEKWNQDMELKPAFISSCIWYFRTLTDEVGEEAMQSMLLELEYGNGDSSDWEGRLNQNNHNRALTGFWVESSLLISPKEQTEVLSKIFDKKSPYDPAHIDALRECMIVDQDVTDTVIWGKTGLGKLGKTTLNAWFVGMFEEDAKPVYFAIHLGETENPEVSSALAKEIAIRMIDERMGNQKE